MTKTLSEVFQPRIECVMSTDDPLQLHHTKDALLEEYSVALQVYGLRKADLCELARNSVLQSGFEHPFSPFSSDCQCPLGPAGNNIHLTNVPNQRLLFRYGLVGELELLRRWPRIQRVRMEINKKKVQHIIECFPSHAASRTNSRYAFQQQRNALATTDACTADRVLKSGLACICAPVSNDSCSLAP